MDTTHGMYIVCTHSEHSVLHIQDPSLCPGFPAHCKSIQLGCECSVRLSGAVGIGQAAKQAFTQPGKWWGSPSKTSLKLQCYRKLMQPCLRDTLQLPKGFLFKYQNYKSQFINCFSKTIAKTK